ncbi:MAG: NYN domain-containing protein [Elusimicrobiaceae bacterium]|nr:NYN domain-containing protein [Elusimicrobiaceae bacterium]
MTSLIIDGSNVIRSAYGLQGKPNFDLEARLANQLVQYLSGLNTDTSRTIECYFDGFKRTISRPRGLSVFFSAKHKADKLIVNSVYEHTQNYAHDVCVVTADNDIIRKSRACGANVQYTYDFLKGFWPYIAL